MCLLRELNHLWKKNRSGFLRFPNQPDIDLPHLICEEGEFGYEFNLRALGVTVFHSLSFNDAIAAFFHLTFAVGLRYPENGEAVAVWLQRKVAGLDEKGKINYSRNELFLKKGLF